MSGIALATKYRQTLQRGIVIGHSSELYPGPNEHFPLRGTLEPLTEVAIHEIKDGWCKIETNKLIGWMIIDSVERV